MRLTLFVIFLAACGGGSGTSTLADAPDTIPPDQRYEPWTVGAVWSYKLSDPKGVIAPATNKLTTVMPMQDVGGLNAGKQAFVVHIEKLVGSKDVWETFSGDLDIRYKTKFYDANGTLTSTDEDKPYRLKLDETMAHVAPGATYTESFNETTTAPNQAPTSSAKSYTWKVISATEQVTVPAGTYTCLHVQRDDGTGPQDYWYARSVGKVKETGGSQIEELMSYTP